MYIHMASPPPPTPPVPTLLLLHQMVVNRYDPYWINYYINMSCKLGVKLNQSHDCAKTKCELQWPMSRQLKISLSLGQEGAGPDVIFLRRNNSALISSSRCHHYFASKRKPIECYQNLILQQGPIYFSLYVPSYTDHL